MLPFPPPPLRRTRAAAKRRLRIPVNRLDLLAKQGLIRDFTRAVMDAEKAENIPQNARRIWVTIHELEAEDWGIGGHTDWLRDYTSALDAVGAYQPPR